MTEYFDYWFYKPLETKLLKYVWKTIKTGRGDDIIHRWNTALTKKNVKVPPSSRSTVNWDVQKNKGQTFSVSTCKIQFVSYVQKGKSVRCRDRDLDILCGPPSINTYLVLG